MTGELFRTVAFRERTLEDSIGNEYSKLQERIREVELKHGEYVISVDALNKKVSVDAVAAAQREDMINGMNRLNQKLTDLLVEGRNG